METTEEIILDPELQNLVNAFRLRSARALSYKPHKSNAVYFYDDRYPEMPQTKTKKMVGYVAMVKDSDSMQFHVRSRLINNERYRVGSQEYHTKVTKSFDKALKLMIDFIRPYGLPEVMSESVHKFTSQVEEWVSKARRNYNDISVDNRNDLVTELLHLKTLGVQFKTDTFRDLSNKVEETTREYKRRTDMKIRGYHVVFTSNIIYITSGIVTGSGYSTSLTDIDKTAQTYHSETDIPENILSKISFLKMVEKNEALDEVGIRVNDYEFYIFEEVDNSKI